MEKLLHERLREEADFDAANFSELAKKRECRKLADEIERYYIPRPRFEDGTPVQFGDEVEGCDGGIRCIRIYKDGAGRLFGENDNVYCSYDGTLFGKCEKPKRPVKVLDANGVEINSGDKLWELKTGHLFRVKSIKGRGIYVSKDGYDSVHFRDPKCFTHNEMDSLEKLRDDISDMALSLNHFVPRLKLKDFADRLTAIMERE